LPVISSALEVSCFGKREKEKIPAKHLRDAEDEVPIGKLPQDILTEPLPEPDHPFLITRWAEVTPLAGEV
jgi:hypothetical protein